MRFDTPFPGGVNLGGQCGEGEGAICMTSCLQAGEGTSSAGPEGSQEELPSALDIVFDTAIKACITKPTILLLKVVSAPLPRASPWSLSISCPSDVDHGITDSWGPLVETPS